MFHIGNGVISFQEGENNMFFYKCEGCGNFISFLTEKTACTPKCCGEEMKEIKANTTDGAHEKHVPVITIEGDVVKVEVGEAAHPMLDNHYIQFIILETRQGIQKKDLKPGDEPVAEFALTKGDEVIAAYEYCNLHGLWSSE